MQYYHTVAQVNDSLTYIVHSSEACLIQLMEFGMTLIRSYMFAFSSIEIYYNCMPKKPIKMFFHVALIFLITPASGNYCACLSAKTPLDDQVSHIRPRFDSRHEARENNLSEVEAKKAEGNCEDETSMVIPDLFHGFLAIGTLGSEYGTSEPATPTFPRSLENIADEKIEVTDNDLKVLKDETRKFLDTEAEAKEDCNESLGRNSCISTITLGGMQMKGAKADDYVKVAPCPRQGYLFGSLRELPETTVELEKEKASPGEVFQRKKLTDETSAETEGKREMHAKQAHKSAKHLIKKILRKFHPSRSPAPPSTNEAASSVSTKKKLNKVSLPALGSSENVITDPASLSIIL